jgi:hypothetical protein
MKKITVYKDGKEKGDFPVRRDEGNISRRNLFKGVVGGLCMLATSGVIHSCACLKRHGLKTRLKDFWKRVDEIHARDLVDSVISAGRAQVEYSRSLAESERAVILLGSDAGKEHHWRAEEHFRKRTEELRNAKTALARLASRVDKDRRTRFNEFLSDRGIASLKANAREFVVERLSIATNIMPDDAKKAMQKLDKNLDSIGRLRSFEDVIQLLDQRLDALTEKKFANPGISRGLCILILLLTSMFIVLLIVAILVFVLVCALTFGLLCQQLDLNDILDDVIDDICGP